MLRRRRFLEFLGYAAVSVQILPLTGCSAAAEIAPEDSLAVTSSRTSKLGQWAAHTHTLYVPRRLFRDPPQEGVTLSTTRASFHSHEVALTQAQLATIAGGATLQIHDTSNAHEYSISLS